MSTFFKGLTTKGGEVVELQNKVDKGKETTKDLKKHIVELKDEIHDMAREQDLAERLHFEQEEDTRYQRDRIIKQKNEEVNGNVAKAEKRAKEYIIDARKLADEKVDDIKIKLSVAKDDNENSIRRMKEEVHHREDIRKAETDVSIKEVKLLALKVAEDSCEKKVNDLYDTITELKADCASNEATSVERLTIIDSLTKQIEDYKEFIKFAMTKLPDVDLKKLNVNIDIPATTVINKTEVIKSK